MAQAPQPTTRGPVGPTAPIPSVIVLDFDNLSGYGGALLGKAASAAVAQAMDDLGKWDIVRSDVVANTLRQQGLSLPLDVTGMMKLGRALEADAVVTGKVFYLRITDSPRQAEVGLRVEMRDVASGELINGAIETAASSPRPGYQGDNQALIDEALRKAAFAVVNRMAQQLLPRGTVLTVQVIGEPGEGTREVLLNVGAADGVTEGMEFIVLRGGDRVARIRAVRVESDQTTARVVEETRGVRPEDKVVAVFSLPEVKPQQPSAPKAPKVSPRKKKSILTQALIGLLGIGALVLIFRGSSKSGKVKGPGGSPVAQATSAFNGAPVLPGQAAVKVSWIIPNNVRLADIIEFQILRFDGPTPQIVGRVDRTETEFFDTPVVRDVTITQTGTTQTGAGGTTGGGGGAGTTTLTAVPGITPGRSVRYAVQMVFRRQTSPTGGGVAGGGVVGGGVVGGGQVGGQVGGGGTQIIVDITPIANTGVVTPLTPPVPSAPSGGDPVDPTSVTFSFEGSEPTANEYIVEVATTPDFRDSIQLGPLQVGVAQRGGTLTLERQNLSQFFPGKTGTFFWRVGARNRFDSVLPDPGRWANLKGDRRWVYSDFETFTVR